MEQAAAAAWSSICSLRLAGESRAGQGPGTHPHADLVGGVLGPAHADGVRVEDVDLQEVAGRPVSIVEILRLAVQPAGVRHPECLRHLTAKAKQLWFKPRSAFLTASARAFTHRRLKTQIIVSVHPQRLPTLLFAHWGGPILPTRDRAYIITYAALLHWDMDIQHTGRRVQGSWGKLGIRVTGFPRTASRWRWRTSDIHVTGRTLRSKPCRRTGNRVSMLQGCCIPVPC